jgi:cytochrome P450
MNNSGLQISATVLNFILAMILYPDVQQKAQAELDKAIGRERLPDLSDKDDLPYVGAICKEILRWMPVTPLNVPHTPIIEDVYEGMRIPKGSLVISNSW